MNGVLFCLFTTKVRDKLKVAVARLYYCQCWRRRTYNYDLQFSTNSASSEAQVQKKVVMSENTKLQV